MSSINNLANYGGYYQLSGQSNGQSGTNGSATDALLQALNSSSASGASSTNSDAYLLNLSPQAQQYLSGTNSALPGASGSNGSYVLSSEQQAAITDILTKYKGAPQTQDTFNKIQNDLNAAGLGASVLSLEDQAKSFNPAMVLINALNGGSTDGINTGVTSSTDEQSKASAYMQQIISQWKNISGNNTQTAQTGIAPVGSAGGA